MRIFGSLALLAIIGAWGFALSSAPASAAVVCSGEVCWHTHESYDYPPNARVIVHPDDWRWKSDEHFSWKEHEGRGYWHGGDWDTF
jgi:hypothetical protein